MDSDKLGLVPRRGYLRLQYFNDVLSIITPFGEIIESGLFDLICDNTRMSFDRVQELLSDAKTNPGTIWDIKCSNDSFAW